MTFFSNRQPATSCQLPIRTYVFNQQLGSESAKSRVGKGRVWLGKVGLGLGRIGVSNADSDLGF